MSAIAAEEPVVLLIDEIDKTDQEFEAMLLELLSDFQISIPELGRFTACTRPIVLLTSNNTRELTEALKRRCLYLWIDYPALEHELEIVRLHTPDLDETIARRLVEVIAMVRELDLEEPPSIAESVDWARALLLLGAQTTSTSACSPRRCRSSSSTAPTSTSSPTASASSWASVPRLPDRPSSRRAALYGATAPEDAPPGLAAKLLEFGEELRGEGVAVGTSELLDAFAILREVPWTSPADFKDAIAATVAKSQEDRRIYDLVFDRFFFRAAELAAVQEGVVEGGGIDAAGADLNLETLRQEIARALREGREGLMRDLARLAIAAFGRHGEGSGVVGVDVQRIRRALGLRPEPQPDLDPEDPRFEGLPRDAIRRFEALLRQLERAQIERTESLPPARPLNELDRALPSGRCRTSPPCTASSPSSSGA